MGREGGTLTPTLEPHVCEMKEALALNNEQQQAIEAIRAGANTFQVSLLDGVTGSGKTEVYLQVVCRFFITE